jgi:hypothetical protein
MVPNEIARGRQKIRVHFSVLSDWLERWQQAWGSLCGWGCSTNIFTCLTVVIQVLRVWRQAVEVTISYCAGPPPSSLTTTLLYVTVCACMRFSYRVLTNIFWAVSYRSFVGEFTGPVVCDATRSRVWIYVRSLAGKAGSNSVGVINICPL